MITFSQIRIIIIYSLNFVAKHGTTTTQWNNLENNCIVQSIKINWNWRHTLNNHKQINNRSGVLILLITEIPPIQATIFGDPFQGRLKVISAAQKHSNFIICDIIVAALFDFFFF